MIGMNQIKRKLVNGILIGLAIGLVLVIVTIIISSHIVKTYKEGTNKNFLKDYTSEVVTFNRDVVQGEKITEDMLQVTRIHNNTTPSGAITSKASIVGNIVKYNVARNSTAVASMVSDKIVAQDVRIQEINAIVLPIDLAVGDFVDIRIMYPSGVEYTVLAQKQVTDIASSTIWMDMSEADTLMLNSAIVDSYLTDGTKLYAVKYTDPTTQIKLDQTEEAESQAEIYLKKQIGNELAGIKSITDVYETEAAPVAEQGTESEVVTEENTATTVTATQKILDIVTKYAKEYRYYVESYNKTEADYQPNAQVMARMKTNKYIVDTAKAKLDATIRKSIENSIAAFENSAAESYESVVGGIETSINAQQALRNQTLGQE